MTNVKSRPDVGASVAAGVEWRSGRYFPAPHCTTKSNFCKGGKI